MSSERIGSKRIGSGPGTQTERFTSKNKATFESVGRPSLGSVSRGFLWTTSSISWSDEFAESWLKGKSKRNGHLPGSDEKELLRSMIGRLKTKSLSSLFVVVDLNLLVLFCGCFHCMNQQASAQIKARGTQSSSFERTPVCNTVTLVVPLVVLQSSSLSVQRVCPGRVTGTVTGHISAWTRCYKRTIASALRSQSESHTHTHTHTIR